MIFTTKIRNAVFVPVLLCACMMVSCVGDLDVDQVDDILFTPEVEFDLIYFNFDASRLDEAFTANTVIRDTTDYAVYNTDFVKEHLNEAILHFDLTNSLPESFDVDLQFLTENDALVKGVTFHVYDTYDQQPFHLVKDISFTKQEIVDTHKMVLSVVLIDPPIYAEGEGSLIFKSSGTYYLEVDVQ